MKRIIMLIYCMSMGPYLAGKTMLISPPNRSNMSNAHDAYLHMQELLTSCKPYTLLLEANTAEEAFQMLYYLPTLKQRNKTILYKAPENILPLLAETPYIDQIVRSDTTVPYTTKITNKDLAHYMEIDTSNALEHAPLITVNDNITDLWQETFDLDANFKIGIYCEPLHNSDITAKHKITADTFFPLALLHNISIYSFDTLMHDTTPEHVTIYHFAKQAKESLADVAALIRHMNLIITTQPIVAYIAEALHKPIWLIVTPEADVERFIQKHPHIQLFCEPTDERLLCTIIRKLSNTIIKPTSELITAEIAIGELIDKITILEIKAEQISDEKKLENIYRELQSLHRTCNIFITPSVQLQELTAQLKNANHALWITEDLIRDKERAKCFDSEFIQLARSVYIQNDERCRVKRCINELLGSRLIEEKSYRPYN